MATATPPREVRGALGQVRGGAAAVDSAEREVSSAAIAARGPQLKPAEGKLSSAVGLANLLVLPLAGVTQFIPWVMEGLGKKTGWKRLETSGTNFRNAVDKGLGRVLGAPLGHTGRNFVEQSANNASRWVGDIVGNVSREGTFLGNLRIEHLAALEVKKKALHTKAMEHLTALEGKGSAELDAAVGNIRGKIAQKGGVIHEIAAEDHAEMVKNLTEGAKGLEEKSGILTSIKRLLRLEKPSAAQLAAKSIEGFADHASTAQRLASKVKFWDNPAEAIAGLPSKIGGIKLSQVAEGGFYYLGQGASVLQAGNLVMHGADEMKMVDPHAHLIGHNKSEAARKMQREFLKIKLPQVGILIAGIIAWATTRRAIGGSLFSPANLAMAVPMFSGNLFADAQRNSLTTALRETQTNFQKTGELPAGAYAALMIRASKDAEKMGVDNPELIALAKHYAESHTAPAEVVKELDHANGGIAARIAELHETAAPEEEIAAEGHPAAGKPPDYWQTKVAQPSPAMGTALPGHA